MSNLVSALANANGRRASVWHNILGSGRAASTLVKRTLILASLVVAATIISPRAAYAAPVGAVGPSTARSAAFAAPVGAVRQSATLQSVAGTDPPITFDFTIGPFVGSGSLASDNLGSGVFLATSGTLTMSSAASNGAIAGNSYCLVPLGFTPLPGQFGTSPLGAFYFDDTVAPGANPAFPNIYALLFSNNYGACASATPQEINIWATDGTPSHYSFYSFSAGTGLVPYDTLADSTDSFNATVVTTTYTYAGRGFKLFGCSPAPDCSNPVSNYPYGPTNSVTATVQLAAPLCAPGDVGHCSTAAINVLCSPNFVKMTLNDGVNTVSATNCNAGAAAWAITDANGNITAWYLDATAVGGKDIHTVYDPGGVIGGVCNNCYFGIVHVGEVEEDKGSFLTFYGYNLRSRGSFSPAYTGGSTTAGNCTGQSCTLVPGNTFTIKGPNAAAIPPGAVLTQQECVVPTDPRGLNCGATNGHLPRSLNVADLPQCKGFGNEVIPDYLCGASGSSKSGFALILGNAEQIDSFNGTYGDSELDVEKIPDLAGAPLNPTCPKNPLLAGQASALAAVSTRSSSLVEEQQPERTLDGRPILLELTSSCDPPKSNHGPGLTLEGVGFKLRTKDPAAHGGLTEAQQLLVLANYKFLNLDAVMLLTKFPTGVTATTRQTLQSCINKSQALLNSGPSHYMCAAEQVYRCEQFVDGADYRNFGPSTRPLRLPDPYGDVVRRLGNLYYTINTRINGQAPNVDWPLPLAVPTDPTSGDPYPLCPL